MNESAGRNSSDILLRLGEAIEPTGSFPLQAPVLRAVADEMKRHRPNLRRLSYLVSLDAVLCARLLHIYNSPAVSRDNELLRIRQVFEENDPSEVLSNCSSMVIAESFTNICRKSPRFRDCLSQSILLPLITAELLTLFETEPDETSRISALLYGLGPLTLGYYYPQIYKVATERAERRNVSVSQSIRETLGMPPFGISIGLAHFLNVPTFHRETVTAAYATYVDGPSAEVIAPSEPLARALGAAGWLSELLCHSPAAEIAPALSEVGKKFSISECAMQEMLEKLPRGFARQCRHTDLRTLPLPRKLEQALFGSAAIDRKTPDGPLQSYLQRIQRNLAATGSLPCVASIAMEALVFELHFDRAVLLMSDENCRHLYGTLSVGSSFGLPARLIARKIRRPRQARDPVQRSFISGTICTDGPPMFPEAKSFAALPIGQGDNTVGVIYADCLATEGDGSESVATSVEGLRLLTDFLHDAVQSHL